MSHKDKVKIVVRVSSGLKDTCSLNYSSNNEMSTSPNCALHVFPFTNQIILAKSLAKKPFVFDYVFDENVTQLDVYNNLESDFLPKIFEGCDTSLILYGHNKSGKSYTAFGKSEGQERGIIPRLYDKIFKRVSTEENDSNQRNSNKRFKMEMSHMEIYNEKVYDLSATNKVPLKVREHPHLGAFVDGLSQIPVVSPKDIDLLTTERCKNNMGGVSSHIVMTLTLTSTLTDSSSVISEEQSSKFSIICLAPLPSQSNDLGKQTKDIANLNKSLSALGLVISKLAEGKTKSYISYRDSVLTWLLRDRLEGNGRLTMIATVSASPDKIEETLSTLRYAERAKTIVCNPVENLNAQVSEIRKLEVEAKQLRDKLQSRNSGQNFEEQTIGIEDEINETGPDENLDESDLKRMGLSVEESGIQVSEIGIKNIITFHFELEINGKLCLEMEKDRFYLINLNENPSPDELLVYHLNKHKTTVGRPDGEGPPDIQLSNDGIGSLHCLFTVESDGNIYIIPFPDCHTYVNGVPLESGRKLRHGDNVGWGSHCQLRLHTPVKNRFTSLPVVVQSDSCGIVFEKPTTS